MNMKQLLALLHMAVGVIYSGGYAILGMMGLIMAWGGFWGVFGTVFTVPIPYGVYAMLYWRFDWPLWAAIIGAIPGWPVILIALVRAKIDPDADM
jgi:hypothetical protein